MKRLLPASALLAALLLGVPAHASPFQRARVSQIVNKVSVIEPSRGVRPAQVDEEVSGETAVRTGAKSRSELVFPDETVTRLGSNTFFSFREGSRDMNMKQGVMLLQAPKGAGGAKITTGAVTAAITGTTIIWEVPPPGTPPEKQFTKLICIEANKDGARFFFNDRPLDSILVPPGFMIIVPPGAKSLLDVEPVPVNIRRLLRTSLLVNGLSMDRRVTPFVLSVIDPVIFEQEEKFARKELLPTNLVIDGGGTAVLIATDFRTNADHTLALNRGRIPRAVPVNDPTPTPAGPTPVPTPGKFGAPPLIASPNPYTIVDSTRIVTDPTITTYGVTDKGTVWRNMAADGPIMAFTFGTANALDGTAGLDDATDNTAVFKFANLVVAGSPTFDTTNGPSSAVLAATGNILSDSASDLAGANFNFTLAGLAYLALVADGDLSLGSSVNFIVSDGATHTLSLAARGAQSYVSLANTIAGANLSLTVAGAVDVYLDSFIDASMVKIFAGNDVSLGDTAISADALDVVAGHDIAFTPFDAALGTGTRIGATNLTLEAGNSVDLDSGNFVFLDGDTFNATANSIEAMTDFEFFGNGGPQVTANLAAGAGGILATDSSTEAYFNLTGFANITSAGDVEVGDIGTLQLDITNGGSLYADNAYGEMFAVDGDVDAATLRVRDLKVNGAIFTSELSAWSLTGTDVAADLITPYDPSQPHTFTVNSLDSFSGIQFNGADTATSTPPGNGGSLTLNIDSALFQSVGRFGFGPAMIASATFDGGGNFSNATGPGGDGGTFIVNALDDIAVDTPITATTGVAGAAPSATPAPSGRGGTIGLHSENGQVAVNSRIEVSSDAGRSSGGATSAQGGNIAIESQVADTTAVAVNITNSAQLYSLLSKVASPGPGGIITVQSAGGQIVIDAADVEATKGTVDIRNNGGAGTIAINGTQIAADVIKIGALGTAGVLNIQAGSRLNADSSIKLYGGLASGEVRFSGSGTVDLNGGNQIDIAAKTVTIEAATSVNNNAANTRVSSDNRNYNTSGFGSFTNPVTEQSANQAPAF